MDVSEPAVNCLVVVTIEDELEQNGRVANWPTCVWSLIEGSFSLQQKGFHAIDRTSSSFLL